MEFYSKHVLRVQTKSRFADIVSQVDCSHLNKKGRDKLYNDLSKRYDTEKYNIMEVKSSNTMRIF